MRLTEENLKTAKAMSKYRKAFETIAGYRYWNSNKPTEDGFYNHKHFQFKFPKEFDLLEDLVELSEAYQVEQKINYKGSALEQVCGDCKCGRRVAYGQN